MNKGFVSIIIFHTDDNQILMHQRGANDDTNVWELMGGRIEEGELPIQAIKREIKEELGYEVTEDQLEYFKHYSLQITEDKHKTVHVFKCRFPGLDSFTNSEEVTIKNLQLFTIEEAKKKDTLPITQAILQDL